MKSFWQWLKTMPKAVTRILGGNSNMRWCRGGDNKVGKDCNGDEDNDSSMYNDSGENGGWMMKEVGNYDDRFFWLRGCHR